MTTAHYATGPLPVMRFSGRPIVRWQPRAQPTSENRRRPTWRAADRERIHRCPLSGAYGGPPGIQPARQQAAEGPHPTSRSGTRVRMIQPTSGQPRQISNGSDGSSATSTRPIPKAAPVPRPDSVAILSGTRRPLRQNSQFSTKNCNFDINCAGRSAAGSSLGSHTLSSCDTMCRQILAGQR